MDQGDIEQMSFEAALAELEQIVRSLEQGQAPLDESIELYQRGDRLKRHCEARLKAAQARIEQISLGPDGQPKDPVTLGLTSQRELDAAVAKAQKAAGMEARQDTRLDSDRASLIEELRAEREAHAREAEAALAAAEAEANGEELASDEIVPGIKDPFKRA